MKNYRNEIGKILGSCPLLKDVSEHSMRMYFSARNTLWTIERNIKIMTEELYMFGMSIDDLIPLQYRALR